MCTPCDLKGRWASLSLQRLRPLTLNIAFWRTGSVDTGQGHGGVNLVPHAVSGTRSLFPTPL